jgi:hypothetical protein
LGLKNLTLLKRDGGFLFFGTTAAGGTHNFVELHDLGFVTGGELIFHVVEATLQRLLVLGDTVGCAVMVEHFSS